MWPDEPPFDKFLLTQNRVRLYRFAPVFRKPGHPDSDCACPACPLGPLALVPAPTAEQVRIRSQMDSLYKLKVVNQVSYLRPGLLD